MEYKVLIKLYVPEIEETYELSIPVNRHVGEIANFLAKIVNILSKVYPLKQNASLCNRRSGIIYDQNLVIRESDIRNGTELVLF